MSGFGEQKEEAHLRRTRPLKKETEEEAEVNVRTMPRSILKKETRDLRTEMGNTERASVSFKTRGVYTRLYADFLRVTKVQWSKMDIASLDRALVGYFDHLVGRRPRSRSRSEIVCGGGDPLLAAHGPVLRAPVAASPPIFEGMAALDAGQDAQAITLVCV